jgi:hypothetical protein
MLYRSLALTLLTAVCLHAQPPPGYRLAFDDEFSAPTPSIAPGYGWIPTASNPETWGAHTPYSGDFGYAYFTGPGEPGTIDPFSVTPGGHLQIRAYYDDGIQHWRSGLISSLFSDGTGFSVQYGYFEARLWLAQGKGTWPAFWLGDTANWDNQSANRAEIDILEAYGDVPTTAFQAVHIWNPQGTQVSAQGSQCNVPGLETGWHTFGCWVAKDFIRFYIDGKQVWIYPTFPEATHPLYAMVDLALNYIGDNLPDPACMYVDYVRVYAPPPPKPTPTPVPVPSPTATPTPTPTPTPTATPLLGPSPQ